MPATLVDQQFIQTEDTHTDYSRFSISENGQTIFVTNSVAVNENNHSSTTVTTWESQNGSQSMSTIVVEDRTTNSYETYISFDNMTVTMDPVNQISMDPRTEATLIGIDKHGVEVDLNYVC